jgi:hypothetical protein
MEIEQKEMHGIERYVMVWHGNVWKVKEMKGMVWKGKV